jgi:hypothetical protein
MGARGVAAASRRRREEAPRLHSSFVLFATHLYTCHWPVTLLVSRGVQAHRATEPRVSVLPRSVWHCYCSVGMSAAR